MAYTGYHFGHKIESVPMWDIRTREEGTEWVFADTKEPLFFWWSPPSEFNLQERVCPSCGGLPTEKGHDPCIADLPGVAFACCGHGVTNGYVKFEDGRIIRGRWTHVKAPQ